MKLTQRDFEDLRSLAIILERHRVGKLPETVAAEAAVFLRLAPLGGVYHDWLTRVVADARETRERSIFGSAPPYPAALDRRTGPRDHRGSV